MSSGQGKFPLEVVTDNNLLRQRYENDELEGKLPLYVTTTSAQGIGKMQAGGEARYFTEVIYSLAADSVGSAGTTPQQLAAIKLPSGGLSVGSLIRLTIAESKSGTSETMTGGIYIGPAGNNTDQLITAAPTLAGTAVSQGGIYGIEITSTTSARGAGALTATGNFLGTSTSSFTEKTIGDIRSVDNWISIYTTMSGSVEVPTLRILTVEVVPGTA